MKTQLDMITFYYQVKTLIDFGISEVLNSDLLFNDKKRY